MAASQHNACLCSCLCMDTSQAIQHCQCLSFMGNASSLNPHLLAKHSDVGDQVVAVLHLLQERQDAACSQDCRVQAIWSRCTGAWLHALPRNPLGASESTRAATSAESVARLCVGSQAELLHLPPWDRLAVPYCVLAGWWAGGCLFIGCGQPSQPFKVRSWQPHQRPQLQAHQATARACKVAKAVSLHSLCQR